jgi:hypothetical protein
MQENSLDACFNVGVDGALSTKPDQSANQIDNPVDSAPVDTQEGIPTKLKVEPVTEEVIVKVEPGTQLQVITAEFYREFLKTSTGYGKTPINQRDERNFIRVLKEQFNKALKPYKTPSNTYPFDEEVANSVFIALHTEERNRTQLIKHNE